MGLSKQNMQSRFKQYLAQRILFSGSKLAGSFIFAKGIFIKKSSKRSDKY